MGQCDFYPYQNASPNEDPHGHARAQPHANEHQSPYRYTHIDARSAYAYEYKAGLSAADQLPVVLAPAACGFRKVVIILTRARYFHLHSSFFCSRSGRAFLARRSLAGLGPVFVARSIGMGSRSGWIEHCPDRPGCRGLFLAWDPAVCSRICNPLRPRVGRLVVGPLENRLYWVENQRAWFGRGSVYPGDGSLAIVPGTRAGRTGLGRFRPTCPPGAENHRVWRPAAGYAAVPAGAHVLPFRLSRDYSQLCAVVAA